MSRTYIEVKGTVHEVCYDDTEVVVLGRPIKDDESHNCDANGCGSIGSHVLARFRRA